jgi:fructosamine-3-kinase
MGAGPSLPAGAREVRPVGGGDINDAYGVVLEDGRRAFVKTRSDARPAEYESEARALAWLAEPGALRTPRVLDLGERHLALEWIERGSLDGRGAEELGRGLAATHAAGAPCFGLPESDTGTGVPPPSGPTRLGPLVLSNEPAPDWPTFVCERRLRPLARMALERGALQRSGAQAIERVCERMSDLAGPPEPPARLHGDLWSGNVLAGDDGRPWLIDPSAYGGHREVDLAMLALFGAPHPRVLEAYREAAPLAAGWEERVELGQLIPLLIHAVLFGGSYGRSAERAARRYAG